MGSAVALAAPWFTAPTLRAAVLRVVAPTGAAFAKQLLGVFPREHVFCEIIEERLPVVVAVGGSLRWDRLALRM